ncbi:MAG: acyl--CoA ligase [Burkholderiales bacterium]|jgi:acyl-CoA synthetase (AMP-forming)/AMP-acid ligase II|uniref:class I adenylate-forming enzyme family protein n=1 Tax=Orrella sp. TaxID=1921583 RepID=UPI002753EEBC|nr:acyl--CoA ligase [Burkholderiales bacterium]
MKLSDLLRFNAQRYGDKVALRLNGKSWSFRELHTRVEDFCQTHGTIIGPTDRVALWFNNSINWLTAFIGINALDAISVPINTRLTASEIEGILCETAPRAVLTVKNARNRDYYSEAQHLINTHRLQTVLIDADQDLWPHEWTQEQFTDPLVSDVRNDLDGLLCIQYTSGTTASPKGAMLSTSAYLATANYVARCQQLSPNSSFISAAPFFHCSGTMHAITVCLLAGCTLNSIDVWDPELFLWETEKYKCDVSHMIYFRDVIALNSPKALGMLTTLKVGHELGTYDYLKRVKEELGIPGLSNLYGMTETCGQFTMWFADDDSQRRLSANGRPQPGNEIRIVEPGTDRTLPHGDLGEIVMKGATLTPGYFKKTKDSNATWTDTGWLRSGDLGSLSENGELTYVARIKDVIRVGGENLAPAEVEQVLREVCSVDQVCVLAMPHERLDEVPIAVICGEFDHSNTSLKARLKDRLAGFKIPREIYLIDEMPLTATNRVQKHLLLEWISQGKLPKLS